ncbi:hypothetical protein GCK72_023660 [Caenorhabditis remanei]|uniref:Uncharacterized protein n=3 Tax=Caenorhabditis TaxID=6237 RepID=E3M2C3_CAERE|nr:hypothetical protein GCK72_023660 [Caenorhabditis remanei]EFO89601.1 hypothetical protein CRE_07434 [Caenorhabditis remanei]KAF1747199.1 hypothetical protein GCK72_023660 [Caenorhabditis remanei]
MGNAVYSDQLVCHDTIDTCRSHCDKSECIFIDNCNKLGQKYICAPMDPRTVMWIIIAAFAITVLACSSLVACYLIRAIRRAYQLHRDNYEDHEINFQMGRGARVHHIEMPVRTTNKRPRERY